MTNRSLPTRRELGAWASPIVLSIAFFVAMGLIVGGTILDLRNDRALAASNVSVSRTLEALEKIRQNGNVLYVAESSQRGYVLTGKESYLTTYDDLKKLFPTRYGEMEALVSDLPEQKENLARFAALAKSKFVEMDRTIEIYKAKGLNDAIANLGAEDEANSLNSVRQIVMALVQTEGRLLTERRNQASDAYFHGQAVSFGGSAIIALALCAFYLLMHRYLRQRDSAQAALEASNAALERRVVERTAELSQLSRHLLNVREGEKKSIARDLHDEFGSYLTAINMDVSRVRDKISAGDPDQAARLDRTLGLLGHAIEMKRRLISDLRPSILDNLGLGAALEQYIDDWARYTGISTTFVFEGDLDSGEEGCPIAIFRVFQEALNNVAKHSSASEVTSFIRREGDRIVFEIADNGVGLTEDARSKAGAHGLLGIRERVLAYHGHLEFTQGKHGGTTIRATLECNTRQPEVSVLAGAVMA